MGFRDVKLGFRANRLVRINLLWTTASHILSHTSQSSCFPLQKNMLVPHAGLRLTDLN